MKKILVFAALSLATATGALAKEIRVAQSYNPDFGSGNVLAAPSAPTVSGGAFEARAQAPASVARKHHHGAIDFNGQSDPDPNIRFQLLRERQENVSGD